MSVRYLIFAAMFAVGFILLQNWSDFTEQKAVAKQSSTHNSVANTAPSIPVDNSSDIPELVTPVAETAVAEATLNTKTISNKNLISVETDVFRLQIDPQGGDIVYTELKDQKKTLNSDQNFVLLENTPQRTYILQSGLIGQNATDTKDARPLFSSSQKSYTLTKGENQLTVDLNFKQKNGAQITKRFIFKRKNHLIELHYLIANNSTSTWSGAFYGQIKRDASADPSSEHKAGQMGLKPFLGFATATEKERFEKFSYKNIDKEAFNQTKSDAWIALIQHYFLSAWIAPKEHAYKYAILKSGQDYYLGRLTSPIINVAAGQKAQINLQIYLGPKNQYRLAEISPGLDLSVDYSFLWWIAQPLYSLLNFFSTGHLHMFGINKQIFPGFGNWGVSIILLTLLVKLLFFKLNQKAYRSMGKMKKFAPKMKLIKDKYPDDRQKQSQAMMELYKKEKINPMGGCLPMLVQMPVFLALYWVLMESVELRHAPFFGWIQDLSAKDPYFILPIIMGASMWFQQRLNPQPADPMQAKVMQWLPIIFTGFFLFFPAGLVLYWVVNNILSIAQQWIISRQLEKEDSVALTSSS